VQQSSLEANERVAKETVLPAYWVVKPAHGIVSLPVRPSGGFPERLIQIEAILSPSKQLTNQRAPSSHVAIYQHIIVQTCNKVK